MCHSDSGYASKVYSSMTRAINLAIYFIYPFLILLASFTSSMIIRSNWWSPCRKIYYFQIKVKHTSVMDQCPLANDSSFLKEGGSSGTPSISSVIPTKMQNIFAKEPPTFKNLYLHSLKLKMKQQLQNYLCNGWNHKHCFFLN